MKRYPISDASSFRMTLKEAGKPSAGQQGHRYGSEIPVDFRGSRFKGKKPEPEKPAEAGPESKK